MSLPALKGPYWVTVRQHRRVLWVLPAASVAGLAAVVALRVWAVDPDADGVMTKTPNRGYDLLRICMEWAGGVLLFLPLLVGAFVAGPMIARELESGTWRLALSQSITARAWLGAKVVVAAAVAVLGSAALAGVYRLGWSRVYSTYQFHWADRGPYEAGGPVLIGYCLLAVAVGALVGQLIRRTLAAMAVTGLLTGLVLLCLGALRWSLLPVETTTGTLSGSLAGRMPGSALLVNTGYLTDTGERLPGYVCFQRTHSLQDCPVDLNVIGWYTDFHPISHYWLTQLIETSIVLVLAAAALYAAFRLGRARRG
ncbi:ABC transporter permease subunit [Streptomyces sp. NPDC090036]|uniref:ABC transporter permease subunit n=1 Tax=Streptomyces sp. NPDC090036 TaxID=3365926 RepID=UPI00380A9A8F